MNTIINYLDNMFLNLPQTKEVLRAKEELLMMMEDKYNELKAEGRTENEAVGIVISEFGNLDELAESLGISGYMEGSPSESPVREEGRLVTMEEALAYLDDSAKYGVRIGLGVMLCIWSPVFLIILPSIFVIGTGIAEGVGILVLLLFVAVAVALFILSGMVHEKYLYLEKELLYLEPSAAAYVQEEKSEYRTGYGVSIALGVMLCILSAIPVACIDAIAPGSDLLESICIGILLFMVGIGVFLFVMSSMKNGSYEVLLQEGDYRVEKKKRKLRWKKE